MDVPSLINVESERDAFQQRLERLTEENEHLRQRCARYKDRLEGWEAENRSLIEQEAEARGDVLELRKKYDALKRKYREALSR